MNNFFERFNPKKDCLQLSLDFIYYDFYHSYPCKEIVARCLSLFDAYRFLKRSNFHVKCKCHPIFFLNPLLTILLLINRMTLCSVPKDSKIAILTYSSAFELYGILDSWNHYVCEIKNNSKWEIYDPYFNHICEDYPDLQVPPLSYDSISKKRTFQFIIWR